MRCRPRSIFRRSVLPRQPNARCLPLEGEGCRIQCLDGSPRPGVKRVYERPRPRTARGCSSTRIWPRGPTKEPARIKLWLKDIALSAGLKAGFGQNPNRWREFHKRYFERFRANHASRASKDPVSSGKVTRLFGAYDTERNNARGARGLPRRHTSRGRCSGSEARSNHRHSLPPARRRRYRSSGCRR